MKTAEVTFNLHKAPGILKETIEVPDNASNKDIRKVLNKVLKAANAKNADDQPITVREILLVVVQ